VQITTAGSILTPGKRYQYTVVIADDDGGTLRLLNGTTTLLDVSAVGTYTGYFTAGTGTGFGIKRWSANTSMVVGSVVVKEVTNSLTSLLEETLGSDLVTNGDFAADTDWTKGTGWTIAAGVASCDGTSPSSRIYQADRALDTKLYKITYTVLNRTQGGVQATLTNVQGPLSSSDGTYVNYLTADQDGYVSILGTSSFIGDIDNVVLEEVTNDSRGTMVVDWTPGASADIDTGNIGMLTVAETTSTSLLYTDASGNRFRSYDHTNAPLVTKDWDANVALRVALRWGIDTDNVRQMSLAYVLASTVDTGTLTDYDGAFTLQTLLLLMKGGTWPQQIKNLKFYDRVLTDAELENL